MAASPSPPFPARNSDSKSTWSPASMNNTSLAHELWKVPLPPKMAPSRPPPGLTGQKLPMSTWDNSVRLGSVWSNSDARYTPGESLEAGTVEAQEGREGGTDGESDFNGKGGKVKGPSQARASWGWLV